MKKILILLSFMCFIKSNAQSNVNKNEVHNLLQSKVWVYEGKELATETYSATKIRVYYDGFLGLEQDYYLSDVAVSKGGFDGSKVGVSTVGRYIVTINGCYEVLEISEKYQSIRSVYKPSNIVNLFVK